MDNWTAQSVAAHASGFIQGMKQEKKPTRDMLLTARRCGQKEPSRNSPTQSL